MRKRVTSPSLLGVRYRDMTPNAIEILIHCYVTSEPHPRYYAPAVSEELEHMERNGLIVKTDNSQNSYRTTERGEAHIQQLCQLEWPRKIWVGSDGKQIVST